LCKYRTGRRCRPAFAAVGLLLWASLATAANYETWTSESITLAPRESSQLRVTYDQIQVRNWQLVVDGGDQNCDVNVRRERDQSLVYQKNDQRHHEVLIPWGVGEAVSIVITNRQRTGAFVVSLQGPPQDQVHASYSYHVNRALDKFAGGQRLAAESECRRALVADPDDGVAKVLLAGFLRDRHYLGQAAALVEEALADSSLGVNMQTIALNMRDELVSLRAPLPLAVLRGSEEAESLLIDGRPTEALAVCDKLLGGELELDAPSRGRLTMLRGQALDQLDRDYESLDAFGQALKLSPGKAGEGIVYFHLGRLFLKMENYPQARSAYLAALKIGLPSGLNVQARDALRAIEINYRAAE
jgi:tetratricopeptide (TPR) repeat protein